MILGMVATFVVISTERTEPLEPYSLDIKRKDKESF